MKGEVRNWVGVMVLLCLGFILGKVTVTQCVKANPQDSQVGRYQLVLGEIEVNIMLRDVDATHVAKHKSLFRIDTVTGEVTRYYMDFYYPTEGDSLVVTAPFWASVTSIHTEPQAKYDEFRQAFIEAVKGK
jgi:hypothetical protein